MQPDGSTPSSRISLLGEWDSGYALVRLSQLASESDLLLQAEPRPERVAIDLSGISCLDACGCQMLAVFLGNLERHGVMPELCGTPAELWEQIRLLGFLEALGLAGAPEKENS
jgi:anti-anti-sigma regulatory factor